MKNFRYKGFTYEMFIRSWKKGDARFEVIRYKNGFRNFWERISYKQFKEIQLESKKGGGE